MSVSVKGLRFDYQAFNGTTGLTDVTGKLFVGGVQKASGLAFTELMSGTSGTGVYTLFVSGTTLAGYGVAALNADNFVEVIATSASVPYPTPIKLLGQVATNDDVIALIGSTSTGTVSGDLAQIYSRIGAPATTSVSGDILALQTQQNTIFSQLTALTNAAQSGAGIAAALPSFLTGSSANTYLIPLTILNNDGALVAPAAAPIIGLKNAAGTDRGSYLTGSSGTPATVNATLVSTGEYTVGMVVPAGAPEEELIFSMSYTVNGNAVVKFYVCQLVQDAATSGYALQTTLLSVQTTVNSINSAVTNATYGLSALQALLANGTYGLAALQSLLANSTYGLSALQSILANGTYGLSALAGLLNNATYGLAALQAQNVATQGTGFVSATNSLVAISAAIAKIPQYGGKGI
jgi:hypothetical protein